MSNGANGTQRRRDGRCSVVSVIQKETTRGSIKHERSYEKMNSDKERASLTYPSVCPEALS